MAKQLKQLALFKHLKKNNLSLKKYGMLVQIYYHHPVDSKELETLDPKWYANNELTEESTKLLQGIDKLFITLKNQKIEDLLGPNYQARIQAYLDLFPEGILPNGKKAKVSEQNLKKNFEWFFQNYNYKWSTILMATAMYVNEYRQKNYEFMRTSFYFIRKADESKIVYSDLADYCDTVLKGRIEKPDEHFKAKVS